MNKLDKQYQTLLQDILDNGVTKQDRTGTGTISVFGRQIRHKMSDGFPLLTTKKMPFKTIVTELLWFLRGDTNIKYLVDNNCHIWDGDAYKNYIKTSEPTLDEKYLSQPEFIHWIKTNDEFAKKWGELGPIYGKQWRSWGKLTEPTISYNLGNVEKLMNGVDQIQNLINDLKTNPDSRRLMVNAWNVGELDQMVLPPCHYGFQVYTRELSLEERATIWNNTHNPVGNIYTHNQYDENDIPARAISLMWNQRSVDTFLGLPFNIASYGLLLEIIAKEVNMVPDELIGNLGDVHLYSNHVEQAKEQIGRRLTSDEWIGLMVEKHGMILEGGDDTLPERTREPFPLPTFDCPAIDEIPHTTFDELVFKLQPADFYMDDYQSHPTIKAPLSN
jgi:thymidylate synthase